MITWGLASAAMIFVTGPKSWYVLRFVLGAAEAGFFPGVAFYLSNWFPKEYRHANARMVPRGHGGFLELATALTGVLKLFVREE
jgi:MFS family permease